MGKFGEAADLTEEEADAITESGHGLCNESLRFSRLLYGVLPKTASLDENGDRKPRLNGF